MRQHAQFKKKFPDCLLFFRMGDFYELFDQDAVVAARALGLTLTERTPGVPMAGVPHHAVEGYLKKLLDQGFRVAVCDQIEDPKKAKGVVKRAVTRVVTPGSVTEEALLDESQPVGLCAVVEAAKGRLALACVEPSTGAFTTVVVERDELGGALRRLGVREVVVEEAPLRRRHDQPTAAQGDQLRWVETCASRVGAVVTERPSWEFSQQAAEEALREQFRLQALDALDLADEPALLRAAGAVTRYVRQTQCASAEEGGAAPAHLQRPSRQRSEALLHLDEAAVRALEIEAPLRPGAMAAAGSLLGIFSGKNRCRTPMGQRLLRQWLLAPLADREAILARQRQVAALVADRRHAEELEGLLGQVQDAARIAGRLGVDRATPRDLAALGRSLAQLAPLRESLAASPCFAAQARTLREIEPQLVELGETIQRMCVDRPPAHLREGGLIREGVDEQLDEARALSRDASSWLAEHQRQLIEQHDLPNLKVGYNRVFGYYIELPRAQAARAPASFVRRQTLKNAERFVTPELKDFEERALGARDRAIAREQALFEALCRRARAQTPALQRFADTVAALDVVACFARKAVERRWSAPQIVDEPTLVVRQGRHPVVEEQQEEAFTPNDLALGCADEPARLALITGPNMAGKSTFIRQAALLVVLAQAGSFVPAEEAVVGVVDRLYTRVGADDALHEGKSTFMVEMTEVARALAGATRRSLVVLDEVGRGTSTLDGLALAWAIAESLSGEEGPRTLFATHYHELTSLAREAPERVRNLRVVVREVGEEIVFLHSVEPGAADRSYGVHVARLAGLPEPVVARARQLLDALEATREGPHTLRSPLAASDAAQERQLSLFAEALSPSRRRALELLEAAQLERLSPLEAFDLLRMIKTLLQEDQRGEDPGQKG